MLLWPYLINRGWLPYRDIAMAHNPLLIFSLAGWTSIFGPQVWLIKIFTLLIILLSAVLLYRLSKSIWTILVWLGLWFVLDGLGLWFDLALVPLGLMLYLLASKRKWFWAGVCWAVMFLTKQTAVFFLIPIFFARPKKEFLMGTVLTLTLFVGLIWKLGILKDYWWWAVKFGIGILPTAAGQMKLPTVKSLILATVLITPGIIGLAKKDWKTSLWALAGVAGAWSRWELFHLQPGLPFIALGVNYLPKKWKIISTLIILVIVGIFIGRGINKPDRFVEPQILQVSQYINQRTIATDTVFVWNTWDNIYALSDRLPATRPWIPQLPWYIHLPGVLNKMQRDLNVNQPEIIVFTGSPDLPGLKELLDKRYTQETTIGNLTIYRKRI